MDYRIPILIKMVRIFNIAKLSGSVGDPYPHVFGPPGAGSISQRYGSGSGSFPFLIDVLSGLK